MIRQIVLEMVQEELEASETLIQEGAIGPTVVDPMLSAMKLRDMDKAKKIFRMSLSQFSPEEINSEIMKRIGAEKDRQNRVLLNALKAQYAAAKPRSSAQQKAIQSADADMALKQRQAAVAAGADQASLPSAKQLTPAATGTQGPAYKDLRQLGAAIRSGQLKPILREEQLREIVSNVLKELIAGLKKGTSAGEESRLEKTKQAHNLRAAKLRAAAQAELQKRKTPPPVPAAAAKQIGDEDVQTDYASDIRAASATPPPVPAAAKKKLVAESTEDFIRKLVKAVLLNEMKKIAS